MIHDPSGFNEGYATLCHKSGTLLSYNLLKTSSMSELITIKPSMAFIKSAKELRTVRNNLLNRMSSCYKHVFMDSLYLTGCFLLA